MERPPQDPRELKIAETFGAYVDWSDPEQRKNASNKQFIEYAVGDVVSRGMNHVYLTQPENPLEALGKYLIEHS